MSKPKVYFTRDISPEKVVEMYEKLGVDLPGKVAVKVHSGEDGNQNYLRPEFMVPMVEHVDGTVVECNTAYDGARNYSDKHKKLLEDHKWTEYFDVDLLDEEGPDVEIPITDGKVLDKNIVGKDIEDYDSILVFSHFKGHPMGGYGGALKQLSIGFASSDGKTYIHSGGEITDQTKFWDHVADQDVFLEAMADSAKTIDDKFKGKAAYINVMKNLSIDCDCVASAHDPCMHDIGILASTDPVALDQACVDLVYASNDPGKEELIKRIEEKHGVHTIEAAEELGIGSRDYELIEVA